MKLTKYGHACVVLEEDGQRLVIDPGGLTEEFGGVENVVGVVITHNHADHLSAAHLSAIVDAVPDVPVLMPKDAEDQAPPSTGLRTVNQDLALTLGPFELYLTHGIHATIHSSLPAPPENLGVRVGEKFSYPGDALEVPDTPVELLALPVSGPWLKLGDALDLLAAAKPRRVLPTHDRLLSDLGQVMLPNWLTPTTEAHGIEIVPLKPGESVEL